MLDRNILKEVSHDAKLYLGLTARVSKIASFGALSKAGAVVQLQARRNLMSNRTNWVLYVNEQGKISRTNQGDKTVGDRQSHLNAKYLNPRNMASMITNYQNYKSDVPMVVVGGKHRAFHPFKIQDGRVVGYMNRVNAVSESTHALLDKMETGSLAGAYSKYFGGQKNKEVTAYHFMQDAISVKAGEVDNIMKKDWVSAISRELANTNLQAAKNAV